LVKTKIKIKGPILTENADMVIIFLSDSASCHFAVRCI